MFGTHGFTGVCNCSGVFICLLHAGIRELSAPNLSSSPLISFGRYYCCFSMMTKVGDQVMKDKEAILRNKNKMVRDISQTLGLPKSTVLNIIKKKASTRELTNHKGTGRPPQLITEEFSP